MHFLGVVSDAAMNVARAMIAESLPDLIQASLKYDRRGVRKLRAK